MTIDDLREGNIETLAGRLRRELRSAEGNRLSASLGQVLERVPALTGKVGLALDRLEEPVAVEDRWELWRCLLDHPSGLVWHAAFSLHASNRFDPERYTWLYDRVVTASRRLRERLVAHWEYSTCLYRTLLPRWMATTGPLSDAAVWVLASRWGTTKRPNPKLACYQELASSQDRVVLQNLVGAATRHARALLARRNPSERRRRYVRRIYRALATSAARPESLVDLRRLLSCQE